MTRALPEVAALAPRLAQFPLPRPLTGQEQLLAQLASAEPEQMAALAAANNDGIRPLKIEPLEPAAAESEAPALPQSPGRGKSELER